MINMRHGQKIYEACPNTGKSNRVSKGDTTLGIVVTLCDLVLSDADVDRRGGAQRRPFVSDILASTQTFHRNRSSEGITFRRQSTDHIKNFIRGNQSAHQTRFNERPFLNFNVSQPQCVGQTTRDQPASFLASFSFCFFNRLKPVQQRNPRKS